MDSFEARSLTMNAGQALNLNTLLAYQRAQVPVKIEAEVSGSPYPTMASYPPYPLQTIASFNPFPPKSELADYEASFPTFPLTLASCLREATHAIRMWTSNDTRWVSNSADVDRGVAPFRRTNVKAASYVTHVMLTVKLHRQTALGSGHAVACCEAFPPTPDKRPVARNQKAAGGRCHECRA